MLPVPQRNCRVDEPGVGPSRSRPRCTLELGTECVLSREAPSSAPVEHRIERRPLVVAMPAHRVLHGGKQRVSGDVSEHLPLWEANYGDAGTMCDGPVNDVPKPRFGTRVQMNGPGHPRAPVGVDLEVGSSGWGSSDLLSIEGELQAPRWAIRRATQDRVGDQELRSRRDLVL